MQINISFEVEFPLPSLEEIELPDYSYGYIGRLNDEDLESLIEDYVVYLFENHPLLYDIDDMARAIEARVEILFKMVKIPELTYLRQNYTQFCDLITYACFKI